MWLSKYLSYMKHLPWEKCFVVKAMAPHSSTLAWKIPWIEEPGRLQSMGSQRDRHDWAISLSLFTFMHWRRKWQPTPVFLPKNPRDGGAWWAAIYGAALSRTQLKRLSCSSSNAYHNLILLYYFQKIFWRAENELFKLLSKLGDCNAFWKSCKRHIPLIFTWNIISY